MAITFWALEYVVSIFGLQVTTTLSPLIQALIRCYIHVIRNGDDDSVARMKAAAEALETKEKVIFYHFVPSC